VDRLQQLIEQAGLPAKMPEFEVEKVMRAIQHDKKVQAGKARFVLLNKIGDAVVTDEVTPSLIKEVLTGNEPT